MPVSRRFLDPDVLARLRGLELRARSLAAGTISGMHRSPYHGFSVEFAEHRQYVPGDDIRYVDWRVFGRADRVYIKEYEAETNLRCTLLLDASRSMAFGSAGVSKFEYAARLAATLAYLLISQQDAAGLLTFDHQVRAHLRYTTGKAQLANILRVLESTQPGGQTDVKILFHRLAEELGRRSMIVLISDLLADPADVLSGLEHICYAGHELIVLHVMDPQEWEFPFVENMLFEGLEDEVRLLADPQSLRASYLAAVERFVTRVRTVCLKHKADYVPVSTSAAIDGLLSGYLAARAGRVAGARRA